MKRARTLALAGKSCQVATGTEPRTVAVKGDTDEDEDDDDDLDEDLADDEDEIEGEKEQDAE